ncbi:MAG: DUF502 domain-containing protein [Candidatus Melainabacteria bacterium]|nr:DUF502 domain-containing protein [Candidatus Melainabacteria bacterium]
MKKYFITGLVILLPLVITIAVIVFLVNLLTEPFIGPVSAVVGKIFNHHGFLFFTSEQISRYTAKIIVLILLFLFTVCLGMVTRWFLITSLFRLGDKILHKIPLVNTVYKTTQDIINTLFVSDKKSFKQVVLVPFPNPGVYVVGLIARESPGVCSRAVGEDLVSVLVPTTPNPTTGFLMMFKRSDILHIDMRPEDAIKYIVSCGVIIPEEGASKANPFHA